LRIPRNFIAQLARTSQIDTEDERKMEHPKVRTNYWAIVVAAISCFMLEALWYSVFLHAWLGGIGRSPQWLANSGVSLYLQSATALISEAIIATAISTVTQLTGPLTPLRGMKVAALLWLSIVFTTLATEYIFEVRSFQLLGINSGFWLLGMTMTGAIVGTWKKK
jgi:hypothetical protein